MIKEEQKESIEEEEEWWAGCKSHALLERVRAWGTWDLCFPCHAKEEREVTLLMEVASVLRGKQDW